MASEIFSRFFDPAGLGKSLTEVSSDVLRTSHHEVLSRWFHSAKDADLFIWMDLDKNVIKQQLSFYGQVVEWNAIEGVRTGHVVIEEEHGLRRGSEVLNFDERPQPAAVEQAIALLRHVEALRADERKLLAENFLQVGRSQVFPVDMLRARFGDLFGGEAAAGPRPTLWRRLFRRLSSWFKA